MQDLAAVTEHFHQGKHFYPPLYTELSRLSATDPVALDIARHAPDGVQPSFLLFGAIHLLLLTGTEHALAEWYASLREQPRDPSTVAGAYADFLRAYEGPLRQIVSTHLVQTNSPQRSVALLLGLHALRRQTDEPVHVVEVGASAGLVLGFERYGYDLGGSRSGDAASPVQIRAEWRGSSAPPDLGDRVPVASTRGVDLHPLRCDDPNDRAWLDALVWPEERDRRQLLRAALDLVSPDPPRVRAGDIVDLADAIDRELPAGEPRVVFHIAVAMHVPGGALEEFYGAIRRLGASGPMWEVSLDHRWVDERPAEHRTGAAVTLRGPDGSVEVLAAVDGHLAWAGDWLTS